MNQVPKVDRFNTILKACAEERHTVESLREFLPNSSVSLIRTDCRQLTDEGYLLKVGSGGIRDPVKFKAIRTGYVLKVSEEEKKKLDCLPPVERVQSPDGATIYRMDDAAGQDRWKRNAETRKPKPLGRNYVAGSTLTDFI